MNFMRLSLGIATIAVGLSSCAAPANDAASAPASHDEAPSWTMPEPSSFSAETHDSLRFRPCEDIPGEVLERLGYQKLPDEADPFAPYGCPLKQLGVDEQQAAVSIQNWAFPIQEMINAGAVVEPEKVDGDLPLIQVRSGYAKNQACEVLIETAAGTLGISRTKVLTGLDGRVSCEPAVKLLTELYGGENVKN